MNKLKKIIFLFVVMFTVICSLSMTVYASQPPTGNVVEMCSLSFRVGYIPSADVAFKGDINVLLTDIATNKGYEFLLKADKGYNANEAYKIIANTTYKATVTYLNADKIQIANADGTAITSYHATASGLIMTWQIKDKPKTGTTTQTTHVENSAVTITGMGDAISMVKSFTDSTQFIANDSNYKEFMGNCTGAQFKKLYLEVEGNTENIWNTMTPYEQTCYTLLFTFPKSYILGANNNIYAKDRATFIKNLDVVKQGLNGLPKGDVVYDALVKAWDWHWSNWESSKRTFINPFEGTTYGKKDQQKNANDFQVAPEDKEDLADGNIRKKLASPNNFLSILKNNIMTIIILVVVGVVIAVLAYKNKQKNYDDQD